MNELDWIACTDARLMFGYLRNRGRSSERKRRLFMCALARSMWGVLADERSRRAVEAAEDFADGRLDLDSLRWLASQALRALDELGAAFAASFRGSRGKFRRHVKEASARADAAAVAAWAVADSPLGFWDCEVSVCDPLDSSYDSFFVVGSLVGQQHALVRELFSNPFSAGSPDVAWRSPNVLSLAKASYENRLLFSGHLDPDRLVVLADALEESGCTDAEILAHLRSPGPHVRGCWVVDLILSKDRSSERL